MYFEFLFGYGLSYYFVIANSIYIKYVFVYCEGEKVYLMSCLPKISTNEMTLAKYYQNTIQTSSYYEKKNAIFCYFQDHCNWGRKEINICNNTHLKSNTILASQFRYQNR